MICGGFIRPTERLSREFRSSETKLETVGKRDQNDGKMGEFLKKKKIYRRNMYLRGEDDILEIYQVFESCTIFHQISLIAVRSFSKYAEQILKYVHKY